MNDQLWTKWELLQLDHGGFQLLVEMVEAMMDEKAEVIVDYWVIETCSFRWMQLDHHDWEYKELHGPHA